MNYLICSLVCFPFPSILTLLKLQCRKLLAIDHVAFTLALLIIKLKEITTEEGIVIQILSSDADSILEAFSCKRST